MNSHRYQSRGFTLLELLVSLVLIGIILSMAVFTLGDGGQSRRIHEEAKRFHMLLQMAQEEAILNNREIVLQIDQHGYRFSMLVKNKLVSLTDEVFRAREFANYIQPELEFDEQAIVLQQDDDEQQDIRIYILSSGELTPFTIRFPADDKSYQIKANIQGELTFSIEEKLS